MAGKYALYLPYKVLDSLSSGNVTDSEFREFIMGLAEYDKSGAFPASHTSGFTMMFQLLKPDLDFAKAKYDDIIEKRRIAGQQGGAPIGNQNAVKNRGGGAPEGNQNAVGNRGGGAPLGNQNARKEAPDDQEPEPDDKKQTQTQTKQTKQADNSSKYSVNSFQSLDIRSSSSVPEINGGGEFTETTTTDLFINKCKSLGYNINRKTAEKIIAGAGIDPAWLSGTFAYPELIDESIKKNYADKPHEEHQRLFISAFNGWNEKLEEYPAWRDEKATEAAAQEKNRRQKAAADEEQKRIERARADKPKTCEHCGIALAVESEWGNCPSCGWNYFFDEKKAAWEFFKPRNFRAEFKNQIRQNRRETENTS